MRSRVISRLLLVVAAGLLSSCSDGYRVVVRFDPPTLAEEVSGIDVALVGRCEAQDLSSPLLNGEVSRVWARRGERLGGLGDVPAGTYGLVGRGRDASCRIVAAECVEVTLDGRGSGDLEIVLSRIDGAGCPPGTYCRDLSCVTGSDGDGDTDIDSDTDSDVDSDVDSDADTDGDTDVDSDVDSDIDSDVDSDVDSDSDSDEVCDCVIEGACYRAGDQPPENVCYACRPEYDTTLWWPLDPRTPCFEYGEAGTCNLDVDYDLYICCPTCWIPGEDFCNIDPWDPTLCGRGGDWCEFCAPPFLCIYEAGFCEGK